MMDIPRFFPGEALEGPPHLYRVLGDFRAILVLHHLHLLILEILPSVLRFPSRKLRIPGFEQSRKSNRSSCHCLHPSPWSLVLLGDQVLDRNVALVLASVLGLLNPIDPLAHVVERLRQHCRGWPANRCGFFTNSTLACSTTSVRPIFVLVNSTFNWSNKSAFYASKSLNWDFTWIFDGAELGLETRDAGLDCRQRCHSPLPRNRAHVFAQ